MHLLNDKKRKCGGPLKRLIPNIAWLSMALCYCAGGNPADICDLQSVAIGEVITSLWDVADVIHLSPEIDINFPQTHEEQLYIVRGFHVKLSIDIGCCVGAIDDILIWIHNPGEGEDFRFGPTRFFCGRKNKFVLNIMGVCNTRGRFLWVEFCFPDAALDYWVFDDLHFKR